MTQPISTQLNGLREELAEAAPEIQAELTLFPSGAAMLDVRRNESAFVMAYSHGAGFAVDELKPDDGFLTGYRHVFPELRPLPRNCVR